MPHLSNTGPEGKGSKTGRKLGECIRDENTNEIAFKLGEGMGMKRNSGGGLGKGKRLKNSEYIKYKKDEDSSSYKG